MRAEANIVNLEIPGELAYVYNKLDDWSPSHNDRHIISVVGDVIPMDMRYKLPNDINSYAFNKYTSVYFKVRLYACDCLYLYLQKWTWLPMSLDMRKPVFGVSDQV